MSRHYHANGLESLMMYSEMRKMCNCLTIDGNLMNTKCRFNVALT